MAVSETDSQLATGAVQAQMQNLERALNARIALAEAEVLRLRAARDDGSKHVKSGILDSRKIYPQPLKDMSRWKAWVERVLRWARMQSVELHAALLEATKSRNGPVTHECGDESIFFWAHLEDWLTDSEALSIVTHVREDDGVEAFRQLNCRFVPLDQVAQTQGDPEVQREEPRQEEHRCPGSSGAVSRYALEVP